MKKAIVIEQSDMKKILADYFNVSEKDVIKSQYSYTVIMGDGEETDDEKGTLSL